MTGDINIHISKLNRANRGHAFTAQIYSTSGDGNRKSDEVVYSVARFDEAHKRHQLDNNSDRLSGELQKYTCGCWYEMNAREVELHLLPGKNFYNQYEVSTIFNTRQRLQRLSQNHLIHNL